VGAGVVKVMYESRGADAPPTIGQAGKVGDRRELGVGGWSAPAIRMRRRRAHRRCPDLGISRI